MHARSVWMSEQKHFAYFDKDVPTSLYLFIIIIKQLNKKNKNKHKLTKQKKNKKRNGELRDAIDAYGISKSFKTILGNMILGNVYLTSIVAEDLESSWTNAIITLSFVLSKQLCTTTTNNYILGFSSG